jgi:16S rRNA (cytosine1402-N4)-methyltransferase
MSEHISVLLHETVDGVFTDPNGIYVDGTFGRGGHSRALLAKLGPNGRLIGIDKDPLAIASAEQLAKEDPRFSVCHGSFANMAEFLVERGLGQVTGVMMDLGVSSPQLDQAERGFSFMKDGPLDMRMDTTSGQSAAQWIASVDEETMANVFYEYGEERYSRRLAKAIVEARRAEPITRTQQLAELIKTAHPRWEKNKHPATRCFQAIRIYLNSELDDLKVGLEEAVNLLAPDGHLAVISFHSLEDRMVKLFIREKEKGPQLPPDLPIQNVDIPRILKHLGKAIMPSDVEVKENPRSRSAVLRLAVKVAK